MDIKQLYYTLKPFIPRSVQISMRRALVKQQRIKYASVWPIHPNSGHRPEDWEGWPNSKNFGVVLTHDVETSVGQDRCEDVLSMEKKHGFRSSFNFVPERYEDRPVLREFITNSGFEIGVHGLNHDGRLYASREEFMRRSHAINRYIESWGAVGFRSPAMHHNLDWIRELNILYDASTFDTDPFEPQPDNVCTIFPFFVEPTDTRPGYVELPYTLGQDFTLFVLLEEKTIDIWKKKVDWIAKHGGMVLVNVHPDYMHFGSGKPPLGTFPAHMYEELLIYIKSHYEGQYWHGLPSELAEYYSKTVLAAHHA